MSHLGVDLEKRARAELGKTLKDKYQLEELLGVGGMAAVYAARHRNGNRVAIKVLYPELSITPEILARFVREGYAANRVNHPGAVRVLDDDRTDDGSFFLVMELLEGEVVDAISQRIGKVEPTLVMQWMDQVLDTLAAAHAEGIVHRDIKPENLFLTREGLIKVLDFGIARMHDPGSASATRTGHPFGTPAFMSPEQALGRGQEVEARSDLFSVGATMFTLLSDKFIHDAENAAVAVVLAATRAAGSILLVEPEMPEPLARVVDKALAFEKTERWESARAMQSALRAAYVSMFGGGLPSPRATSPGLAPAPRKSYGSTLPTQAGDDVRPSDGEERGAPPRLGARGDLLMTAPPTSTPAKRTGGSRRLFLLAGGGAVAAMIGASFWGRAVLTHPAAVTAASPATAGNESSAPSGALPPAASVATAPPVPSAGPVSSAEAPSPPGPAPSAAPAALPARAPRPARPLPAPRVKAYDPFGHQ